MIKRIQKLLDEAYDDYASKEITYYHGKRKVRKKDLGNIEKPQKPSKLIKAGLYANLPKALINRNRSNDARSLRDSLY